MGGTTWTYDFAGLDWEGVDAAGAAWECLHETSQSPVNVAGVEGMWEGEGNVDGPSGGTVASKVESWWLGLSRRVIHGW